LYKLKRQVAARRAQLWWDYPPCCLVPNKHTYFTVLQIVESAFCTSIGSSIWTRGRTSSLWGWWSPGTGCPGRLWILLLWRYSKLAWTRSYAACSRWICFGRGLD